jgi:hypothetical protein
MPRKQKADARMKDIKEAFLEHAADLWDKHETEFTVVLDESELRKMNLTFSAELDFSESTAKLNTTMRFSQVMKDKRTADFDDPNQPHLPAMEDAGKKKKGRGKKEAANDDTDEAP